MDTEDIKQNATAIRRNNKSKRKKYQQARTKSEEGEIACCNYTVIFLSLKVQLLLQVSPSCKFDSINMLIKSNL